MPRKPRRKAQTESLATGPEPISDTLEKLAEKHGLKAAAELPRQLPPPELPAQDTDVASSAQPPESAAEPGPHVANVLSRRPQFRPVPEGFHNVSRHEAAGIRVNKDLDRGIVALQFAEDRLPTREEKNILENVGSPDDGSKFTFNPGSRQWTRPTPEGATVGENLIDAVRLAKELADRRAEGRAR